MPPQPPRVLEAFFAIWIPPACREEVLGDLCEKYSSPAQYIVLAIRTIPCVVLSRARRVTEAPGLFMQALLVYGCYLAAGFYRDSAFLYRQFGLLRAAFPLVPFLLVTIAMDVYNASAKTALRMAARVAFTALITFLAMARTLPGWMNLLGASATLLLVTSLRVLFRSSPDIEQAAGPAHWLKQTPAPIAIPRSVLATAAIVAAITIGLAAGAFVAKPGTIGAVVVIFLALGLIRPRKG